MKLSSYNSFIPIADRHTLLYNALTGKFVTVKDKVIDIRDYSFKRLSEEMPVLYSQLCDAGIVIEDSYDETGLLRKVIETTDNNNNEYILHVNPTLDCNFSCWYCYENHVPHSRMSSEVLESVRLFISSVLKKPEISVFDLSFFGGEPLLYFNSVARPIINHTYDLCRQLNKSLSIHFTSNGYLLTDDIVDYLSRFSCGFQITLDGYGEWHDKTRFNKNRTGSYTHIIKNIHKLAKKGIGVIVRVNYTSENIDGVGDILDSFVSLSPEYKALLRFDFQRVWQDKKDRNDETENKVRIIRDRFREEGFTVLANYLPHNVRSSCYGDKLNHALINYNGDVFGCTARDFTHQYRIGQLQSDGTILYDNERVERRNNSKLSKPVCQKCRIAPYVEAGANSGPQSHWRMRGALSGILKRIWTIL